jgi:hypothetical protein
MKPIRDIQVSQVRIFKEDTIPYEVLSVANKLKELKENFHFSFEQVPFPLSEADKPKIILFKSGEAKLGKRNIIFNVLHFEGRKIVIEVFGTSLEADELFKQLSLFINNLAKSDLLSEEKCLVKTEETKCTVSLDIDFWSIFGDKTKEFISMNVVSALDFPVLSVNPKRLSFEIIFEQNPFLGSHNIMLSPKPLTIEPRTNLPLDERVFYTNGPFSSDVHLQILESFEKTFPFSGGHKPITLKPKPAEGKGTPRRKSQKL